MKTTWGVLDPPVGNTRLNVIRLISSLLQTNTNNVNQELIELNSIGVILVRKHIFLDLFIYLLKYLQDLYDHLLHILGSRRLTTMY